MIVIKFPYRYRVLILLFFLILITFLDRTSISLVGVRIKREFHLSNEQFGWALGAFALAYALFEIPSGALGDRIGQRAVFIRIVLWWSLFTVLTGATTGLLSLICTRFLFGAGEAGAFPNGSAAISRWFPVTETSRGISSLMIGSAAGAAIAPLIVIPIASAYGWRAPFFVNGLIGFIWVIICYVWFRNEPAEMKNISTKEKILIENSRHGIKRGDQFSWRITLANRSVRALVAATFFSQWALYFFIAWMPVYLQEGRHFSENSMKTITSSLFMAGIIGGLSAGFFSDWIVKKKGLRFGRRLIGTVVLGIMSVLFLAAALTPSNMLAVGCLIFCYFFIPVNGINILSTCVDIGKSKAGTVAGIVNCAGQTGAFFLAIVFGKIADATHSFNAPLFVIAGVLLIGCVLWLAVDPTVKLSSSENINKNSLQFQQQIYGNDLYH